MAAEATQVDTPAPPAIQVDTPAPPAQPGILRSKSNSDISTASSDSKASSITFAPLPCVEARKRRHTRPIGIAGRAEMLRRSQRQFFEAQSYEELERMCPDEDDIPLPDIGKLVKGLWRTVSRVQKNKSGREVSRPPNTATVLEGDPEEDGEGSVWMEEVSWTPSSDPSLAEFPRKDHPH
ncbi:hypothetical protein JB92DRAFT_3126168 [Gautieria morchelliformis]|nr:hypothetical protein JB92DRAFT_3126168 [Gautieria morchelliformis]